MPHKPEAGSASQKEAIEEPIDPPFSGRLIAAFFRSKQRDKKKVFYKNPKKLKKKKIIKEPKNFRFIKSSLILLFLILF